MIPMLRVFSSETLRGMTGWLDPVGVGLLLSGIRARAGLSASLELGFSLI
jgi:hypothetical protein